jgi:hypothetical protein
MNEDDFTEFKEWVVGRRRYYLNLEVQMRKKGLTEESHFDWVVGHRCSFGEMLVKLKEMGE